MKLHTIGKQYFEFLSDFTNPAVQDVPESFNHLFSPNCSKLVNGRQICRDVEQIYLQLLEVKKEFIHNAICEGKILTDHEKKTCILHFILKAPTTSYIVTTLLSVDETGLISQISDVYNEIGASN